MGIKGLKSLIEYLNTIQIIHISSFKGKTIAIDISYILTKSSINNIKAENTTGIKSNPNQYILDIINLIHKFVKYGIKVIFIFDGKSTPLKKNTAIKRQKSKQNAKHKITKLNLDILDCIENIDNIDSCIDRSIDSSIDSIEDTDDIKDIEIKILQIQIYKEKTKCTYIKLEHIEKCKDLLDLMCVEWYHIENVEADFICKYLFNKKLVYAILSCDSDFILHGCRIFYDLDYKYDTIKQLYIDNDFITSKIRITKEQLIIGCIASGTDYNLGLSLTYSKLADIIDYIRTYHIISIQDFIDKLPEINSSRITIGKKPMTIPNGFIDRYFQIYDIFTTDNITDDIKKYIDCKIQSYLDTINDSSTSCDNIEQIKILILTISNNLEETNKIEKQYFRKVDEYFRYIEI